jgi:hypothetical protein
MSTGYMGLQAGIRGGTGGIRVLLPASFQETRENILGSKNFPRGGPVILGSGGFEKLKNFPQFPTSHSIVDWIRNECSESVDHSPNRVEVNIRIE